MSGLQTGKQKRKVPPRKPNWDATDRALTAMGEDLKAYEEEEVQPTAAKRANTGPSTASKVSKATASSASETAAAGGGGGAAAAAAPPSSSVIDLVDEKKQTSAAAAVASASASASAAAAAAGGGAAAGAAPSASRVIDLVEKKKHADELLSKIDDMADSALAEFEKKRGNDAFRALRALADSAVACFKKTRDAMESVRREDEDNMRRVVFRRFMPSMSNPRDAFGAVDAVRAFVEDTDMRSCYADFAESVWNDTAERFVLRNDESLWILQKAFKEAELATRKKAADLLDD